MTQDLILDRGARWLTKAGLRPTRQRLCLAALLVGDGHDRHVTAEGLHAAAEAKGEPVSLATVYKSVHTFVELGLLREVSPLHDSQRLDANLEPHHHLVCTQCKAVVDIPADALSPVEVRGHLPRKFRPKQFRVEVLGVCADCAAQASNPGKS